MSEETNTRPREDNESSESGLLLSVESMQDGEPRVLLAKDEDNDSDSDDSGDVVIVDETKGDGADDGGDSDDTDTLGDTDNNDAGDADGTDSE